MRKKNARRPEPASPSPPPAMPPATPQGQTGWRRYLIPLLLFLAGYASFAIPPEWFRF